MVNTARITDAMIETNQALAKDIIQQATQAGATAAEVAVNIDVGFNVAARLGQVETIEYNRDKGLSLTVYIGQRKGCASTSDYSVGSIQACLNKALNIAQQIEEDPCAGLAAAELMANNYSDLDLYHPWSLQPQQAIELAVECEQIALQQDPRLHNSEGVTVATSESLYVYANTHGFVGAYPFSSHSIDCVLLAQEQQVMQRDYSYTVARDAQNLISIKQLAIDAANRTVQRLGAQHLTTQRAPVIFAADLARGIFGNLLSAITGSRLYRKESFLLDQLEKSIGPDWLCIEERPHISGGLASAPFDHEGVQTQTRTLVQDGVLQSYILNSYSARKLGMQTTANAGGVRNVLVDAHNDYNQSQLLKTMDRGLLVTELLGHGVNLVTGDYSRGAFGYWVENGEIQYPVHEITVAGNLREMLQQIVAIGNDIDIRGNIQTGSILLESMMIAGN